MPDFSTDNSKSAVVVVVGECTTGLDAHLITTQGAEQPKIEVYRGK